jgi:hypothetical protein
MSKKYPGMRLADGRDASLWLLTADERKQTALIGALIGGGVKIEGKRRRRRATLVWQEPGPDRFDPTDRECVRSVIYPLTVLSDGTRGHWLRMEWPDVSYPEQPPDGPAQLTLM